MAPPGPKAATTEAGPDEVAAPAAARRGDVPLRTVESTRLYRQIAEQISTLIDRREFPAGSRLPAERELAVLLGVSRTSVREAIIALVNEVGEWAKGQLAPSGG